MSLTVDSISLRAGDSIAPRIMVTVNGVTRAPEAREIVVRSSDTSVVEVTPDGALLAVGHGNTSVTIAFAANEGISVTQLVTVSSETLTGVALTAASSMIPGDTATFVVTGVIRGGRQVARPASVTVTSRNPSVVATSSEAAIAVASGTTWLIATAASGVVDSSLVTVAVGPPVRVIVSPRTASLVSGRTLAATVAMTDRRGNEVTAVAPEFSTTAPAVATVQSDGTVTGVSAGNAMIVAAAGSVADTLRLAVSAPTGILARLVVAPDSVTLSPGGAASIQLQAFDTQGNPMAVPAVTWQSRTAGITVTSSGSIQAAATIVTSISNGTVDVSSGAITAQVRVAVVVPPPTAVLARLVVWPDSVMLSPGATATIQVTALDNNNNQMTLPTLTWQSLTTGITVTSAGVIQAAGTVAATITNGVVQVSSGSFSATVRVVVLVPPPPSDNGYVQIRWVGTAPPAAVAAAFEAARLRINTLFASFNGVAAIALSLPGDYCLIGSPALNETVKGIILFAQVAPIDGAGAILGSAGPCIVRQGTLLPIVGAMNFDSADMAAMLANGLLNGVVLHEMMHTLGFGTIWGPGGQNEVASPGGTDPRFLGTNGQAGYAAVGGADAATGVPVENTGGSGTRGSHWRESVFHTELMTGWADGSMAMSRATVGALKDFGYNVDLSRADAYTLPTSLLGNALRASWLIDEQAIAPIGVVGNDGRVTPIPR